MSFPTTTTNSDGYHPRGTGPVETQARSDQEAPPKYEHSEEEQDSLLPTPYRASHPRRRSTQTKLWDRFLGVFVAFFAVMAILSLVHRLPSLRAACGPWRMGKPAVAHYGGLATHYTLPSGDKIPSVALGVWRAEKGKVGEAVKVALKTGYRHIDGAWIYGNEVEVGQAIKDSGVPRKDIWITSKLWNSFHDPADVEPALDESLKRLGIDYLDLYLIHWPVAFEKNQPGNQINWPLTNNSYPTWQKLEEMVEKGKVRNIGVSNFNIRRIQNLTANPLKIRPAVNQVELSYWNPQPELLKWSKENGLLLEAYSPLGSAEKVKESLEIPEVKQIAKELGMTPAQVYISWHVQRGTVVLPKSVHPDRVEENFQVKALPQHSFDLLEKAAQSHEPIRTVNPKWGVDIFE